MYGPPLTSTSSTDNQPALWVLSLLYTIYALLVLAVRFGIRRKLRPSDQVLIGGYTLGLINWTLLWVALSHGLARTTLPIPPEQYTTLSQLVYAGIATLFLAQACAMSSQCFLISEHLVSAEQRRPCYIATGITTALAIAALLSTLAGCPSTSYLSTSGAACSAQSTRWIVAAVLLSLESCVPGFLSLYVFYHLQTRLAIKIKVYLAFSSAMLNIPLLAGMAITARTYFRLGTDSLSAVPWLVCLQTLLLLSFIWASVPCARPIALKFTTAGLVFLDEATVPPMLSTSQEGSRQLSARYSATSAIRLANEIDLDHIQNNAVVYANDVVHGVKNDDDANSLASYGSERQTIRKTVETEVAFHPVDGQELTGEGKDEGLV